MNNAYDIIGDIHGCCHSLIELLGKLGYRESDGVYRHPSRVAVFLGDFIDREPNQKRTIDIVRPMIESGAAHSVMGNHEFNAISYFTPKRAGSGYLREHSEKNRRQHQSFLREYARDTDAYAEIIGWFRTLPLWLDLGGLRVVHACWGAREMNLLEARIGSSALLDDDLLHDANAPSRAEYEAIETLLKGKEIPLPAGARFADKDGNPRHHIRVQWWKNARNYREAFLGPESALTHIPDDEIAGDHAIEYSHDQPPVFIGHYWMEGRLTCLAPNIACVDYSVGNPGGKLVAYRFDGERRLHDDNFVMVERLEKP